MKLKFVLHSLDTYTLTMGSNVLLVNMVPRVRTKLAIQGSKWVQKVLKMILKCNTEMMA